MGNCVAKIAGGKFRYKIIEGRKGKEVKVEVAEWNTSIPMHAFSNCKSLVEIRLPSTITSIEDEAFFGCTQLEKINLPHGLISIGYQAFFDCHRLNNISLPTTLSSIGIAAFYGCRKLESIIIPEKITRINEGTFYFCQSLTSVTLPSNIESLRQGAFLNCISLRQINIPNTIQYINELSFQGCISLELKEDDVLLLSEDVKETLEENRKNPWSTSSLKERRENIVINKGPGATKEFQGQTQRNYGPEYWSIDQQQVELFTKHPLYERCDEKLRYDFTMREFVEREVIKNTKELGFGLALLLNQIDPKIAHVMVSHAWDEPIPEIVPALKASNIDGPYWMCSSAIYQNDEKQYGPTIQDQLGTNPEFDPFVTVLRSVDVLVAILTSTCTIYKRLWCLYEMYMAKKLGVQVILSTSEVGWVKSWGNDLQYDPCIANAADKVDSIHARCGHSSSSSQSTMNDDERTIRRVIETSSPRGFAAVDEAIELIRFENLLNYDTQRIEEDKTKGRDHLRKAIETIMERLPKNEKFIDYDSFLSRELQQQRHSYESVVKNWDYKVEHEWGNNIGDHDYYIMNKENNDEKIDVYSLWISSLKKGLNDLNKCLFS